MCVMFTRNFYLDVCTFSSHMSDWICKGRQNLASQVNHVAFEVASQFSLAARDETALPRPELVTQPSVLRTHLSST
jgi:hypothetical protein